MMQERFLKSNNKSTFLFFFFLRDHQYLVMYSVVMCKISDFCFTQLSTSWNTLIFSWKKYVWIYFILMYNVWNYQLSGYGMHYLIIKTILEASIILRLGYLWLPKWGKKIRVSCTKMYLFLVYARWLFVKYKVTLQVILVKQMQLYIQVGSL